MAVPRAYIDTTVLLKRYLEESGTAAARRILRRYRVVSSAITPLEAASALCRRRAGGDISDADFRAILRRLAADRAHWELLDLTIEVLDKAEQVIHTTGMRTLDTVHLASALTIQATSGQRQPTKLITGDSRQRDAAIGLGPQVTWVS